MIHQIRRALVCLMLALLSLPVAITWAQQQPGRPTKPAKPAPIPIVTVTKADGSIVRGKLVAFDPQGVSVDVVPAAGAAPAAAAPTVIAWRDITKVSNGMTQAKALAQFKADHAGDLCEACHGDRTVACQTCKGTGHDPAGLKDCKTCRGELVVDCKAPHCKDGKIPCPGKCLKLTEGTWTTKDGLKIRTFAIKGGSAWISEHHLGNLFVVTNDGIEDKGVCPTCGGKTTVTCPTCGGTSKVACPTCIAHKDAAPCTAKCEKGRVTCKVCGGNGLKPAAGTVINNPDAVPPKQPVEGAPPSPLPF